MSADMRDSEMTLPRGQVIDREMLLQMFLDRIAPEPMTGCWLWTGKYTPQGYGRLHIPTYKHIEEYAHRIAYLLYVGPLPAGHQMTIDHLCRVRECVNPSHLESVTDSENKRRGNSPGAINARLTHCAHGHEFTESNTYRIPSRPNARFCRICQAKWREARRRQS